jgi:DNA-binding MarR family transcriptional regulator
MHPTFFRMKRAHHASLRVARQILKACDLAPLTPARFDILCTVRRFRGVYLPQRELARRLGLHPTTISKAVSRLEELGLLRRMPGQMDRRYRHVSLTTKGLALIDRARRDAQHGGHAVLMVGQAVAGLHWLDERQCLRRIRRVNATLRRYAVEFRDTARPLYGPAMA